MFTRSLIGASVLLLAIAGPSVATADTGEQMAQVAGAPLIGTPAPGLRLKTIDGTTIDLGALYGRKAVYLKFWATWCVPCRQQMPHFEETYENEGSDLAVIAVNTGFNDSLTDVRSYRRAVGIKMPIVIDDGRLAKAFHLRVTPQHVVIGRDGRIVYVGHLVDEKLETAVHTARTETATRVAAADADPAAPALGVGASVLQTTLKTTDGHAITLTDPDRIRPTVIWFLSPWCESYLAKTRAKRAAACQAAREQAEQLSKKGSARCVGIASGLWATAEDLDAYRKENQVDIPLSLDETGTIFRSFGIKNVPTLMIVDGKGRIIKRIDRVNPQSPGWLSTVVSSAKSPG
jgi:peroxiredoxin